MRVCGRSNLRACFKHSHIHTHTHTHPYIDSCTRNVSRCHGEGKKARKERVSRRPFYPRVAVAADGRAYRYVEKQHVIHGLGVLDLRVFRAANYIPT